MRVVEFGGSSYEGEKKLVMNSNGVRNEKLFYSHYRRTFFTHVPCSRCHGNVERL